MHMPVRTIACIACLGLLHLEGGAVRFAGALLLGMLGRA